MQGQHTFGRISHLGKNTRFNTAVLLGLIGAAFLLFAPLLVNFFVSDDFSWIFRAESLLDSWYEVIFLRFAGFLRATVNVYFFALYRLFGVSSLAYYAGNIVLHAVNAWLVFTFTLKVTDSSPASIFAALIFLSTPLTSESVIWVSAVTSLLLALFVLSAVNAFWNYLEDGKRRHSVLTLVFALLAMLTHETGVITACLLVFTHLLHWGKHRRRLKRSDMYVWISCIALTLGYLLFQYLFFRNNLSVFGYRYAFDAEASRIFAVNVARVYFWFFGERAAILLVGALVAACVIYAIRRRGCMPKALLASCAWPVIALLPAISFTAGERGALLPSRYFYLPFVGVALFVSLLVKLFFDRIVTEGSTGSDGRKVWMAWVTGVLGMFLVGANIFFLRMEVTEGVRRGSATRRVYESLGALDGAHALKEKNIFIVGDFPFAYNTPYLFDMLRLYFDQPDHRIHFLNSKTPSRDSRALFLKWSYARERFEEI